MLTFSKKYCYKLIRYFQKYRDKIIQSIVNRNLLSETDALNSILSLENLITNLKNCESEIKEINTLNNSKLNKERFNNLKCLIDSYVKQICNEILSMPNILHEQFTKEDRIVYESSNVLNVNNFNIEFSNYVDKYNIRSSNGRVIFMDNDLLFIFNKLVNFFILHNCKNGFHYLLGNEFIDEKYLYCAGQLPGLAKSLFRIDENLFCIPTGEVVIIEFIIKNFKKVIDCVSKSKDNMYKFCTYSKCFRNENTHHSKFNKPLIRQSIFNKVETFIICDLSQEDNTFNLLVQNVIDMINVLNMKYRIVEVGSLEMSKSAYKQYDIEIYFPVTNKYIEVASCSSCHTYQLYRDSDNLNKEFYDKYCTLNCSALPVERILAAYIEYYWNDNLQNFLVLPMLDSNQQPFG